MKYIILTFQLAPNATVENHQIKLELTQYKDIQSTFKAIDSPV